MTRRTTWGRVFRIGFVVVACISLLVNAILLGVGISLSKRGIFDSGSGQALMEIPREVRQAYVKDLRANGAELRRLRDDVRAKRRAAILAAGSQPVDVEVLEKALADKREATERLQAALHATMLKTAEDLSARD